MFLMHIKKIPLMKKHGSENERYLAKLQAKSVQRPHMHFSAALAGVQNNNNQNYSNTNHLTANFALNAQVQQHQTFSHLAPQLLNPNQSNNPSQPPPPPMNIPMNMMQFPPFNVFGAFPNGPPPPPPLGQGPPPPLPPQWMTNMPPPPPPNQ